LCICPIVEANRGRLNNHVTEDVETLQFTEDNLSRSSDSRKEVRNPDMVLPYMESRLSGVTVHCGFTLIVTPGGVFL
jgi:hypothetical protein